MGFTNLKNYGSSDMAWEFWVWVQDAKGNKNKIKKLIAHELKLRENSYNTDGFVNIALYLESEGKRTGYPKDDPDFPQVTEPISKLLTKKQFQTIIDNLKETIADKDFNHRLKPSLRRLLRTVQKKKKIVKEN